MKWHKQQASNTPLGFIRVMRNEIRNGTFSWEALDHGSPEYHGVSNKQAKIIAARLVGTPDNLPWEDAKLILWEAAIG